MMACHVTRFDYFVDLDRDAVLGIFCEIVNGLNRDLYKREFLRCCLLQLNGRIRVSIYYEKDKFVMSYDVMNKVALNHVGENSFDIADPDFVSKMTNFVVESVGHARWTFDPQMTEDF